jgi:hypothetical protein
LAVGDRLTITVTSPNAIHESGFNVVTFEQAGFSPARPVGFVYSLICCLGTLLLLDDPEFPKTPFWYLSEPATGVGFRLFRPLNEPMDRAEKEKFWRDEDPAVIEAFELRWKSTGRGAYGVVDPNLPADIETLKKRSKD